MEPLGLLAFLQNLGKSLSVSPESASPDPPPEPAPAADEPSPDPVLESPATDAYLAFMESHERRAKRIKKP